MRTLQLYVLSLLAPAALLAQEARLTGTLTDPTGSVIVGGQITATQSERNVSFQATTDAIGQFRFPRLPIGTYQIKAEMKGFRTFVQSNVVLTTNADSLLNISMQVGDVAEQVTVTAEASRVATESATVQQLVDAKRIVDLPLNGRNVYQLAALVPGVGPSGMNIGGGKTGSQNTNMVNVRVDGALNVNNAYGLILPSPGPDAVQEFTIQTSVASAKYGMASGVIEVSTRSGTNVLHGSAYEFLRNDKLDARSFFLAQKTKRKRNQYGLAAGGPLVVPKLYDGRNRTFWFTNFEQQKEPLGTAVTIFTPTEAQLRGDFSGVARAIRDPNNNQPFPNNQIPRERLDPLALNFSKRFVPLPQEATGLFRYQRPNDNNPTSFLFRADQTLGGNHQLTARTFLTRRKGPAASGNLPLFQSGRFETETDLASGSHTWTLSPNKINTARFSYNAYYENTDLQPKLTMEELQQLGWSKNYTLYVPNVPSLNVSGYFQASTEFMTLRDYGTYSWSDDFSWIVGRHTLMLGTDGIYTVQTGTSVSRAHGIYTFNGSFSGLGVSDYLLGRPSALRQGSPAVDRSLGLHLAWYLQDDFKVNRRLTLNLGLRYELPLPTWSAIGQTMFWRPGQKSQIYKNAPLGLLFPGDQGLGKAGYDGNKNFWAPRFSFSWAASQDQKTVVRGGYGIYYATSWTNIEGQFQIYQPFIRVIDMVAPPSTADPYANFPGGNPHPYTPSVNSVFDQEITGLAYGPNFREPMMQQWNLNIQREFRQNWLATIGYVGTRGTRIPYLRDMNSAVYIPGQSTVANTNRRRPLWPDFGRFSMIESVVNSNYNSLQASLDRRFAGGLTVLASYTFSKALTDLNSVLTNDGGVPDPNNRRAEWAPADSDRTHALVTSWVWYVPFASGLRGVPRVVLHGWEVNGIWSMYSGGPIGFGASADRALRGQPNRPNRIKDPRLSLDRSRAEKAARYFDTTAVVPNNTGEFGSAPRAEGQLRAPGSVSVTLGINKAFRGFAESHTLEFRTEMFNAFNRPNFGGLGTNVDSPGSFGRITSAGDGRIIQFGLKYVF